MKLYDKNKFEILPDVVMFDLDDTLYDYQSANSTAILQVAELLYQQYNINHADFLREFERSKTQVKKRLCNNPSARNRLHYFQTMFENIGLSSSILNCLNCEQTYWETVLKSSTVYEGVHELLDDLRVLNIPRVLITNLNTMIQFRKLIYFELDDAFDYVVTSEAVGYEKPNPAIFQAALNKLSSENKTNTWMIGDDISADINGAKDAIGSVTLLKRNKRKIREIKSSKCDLIFENFSDIRKLINKMK